MATILTKRNNTRVTAVVLLLCITALTFTSCEKGEEGDPGYAYVALTWKGNEPTYIEMHNNFIPSVFYWDWYYRVDPGIYNVYYEGHQRILGIRIPYAWELEYEVWENPGRRGKYVWEKGPAGPDAYFTIELTPGGPEVFYEEVSADKSAASEAQPSPAYEDGDIIVVEKHNKDYSIRLTYKKVSPRGVLSE